MARIDSAMQRAQREHLIDARIYPDTLFADRQVLAAEVEHSREQDRLLRDQLQTFCTDFAYEIEEQQTGRPTSFKSLLVRAQRLGKGAEA